MAGKQSQQRMMHPVRWLDSVVAGAAAGILALGGWVTVATAQSAPSSAEVVRSQSVRPLPGDLDTVPVFNSNSPERIGTEGILLSTFPATGKANPSAHLEYAFSGRFDVFAHHVYRADDPADLTSMYVGIVLHNPGSAPIRVDVLEAASYLSQPDAPFITLPGRVENEEGTVFAGPGSRAMSDVLRGRRGADLPPVFEIPPGGYYLLLNAPIPVAELEPPLNGRSTLMRLRSNGELYAASLALYARPEGAGERAPTLDEWLALLQTGTLAEPRDRPPTPLDATNNFAYGRVAGVSVGSRWQGRITDDPANPAQEFLTIPAAGEAISFPLSALVRGRMGTDQVQTAELAVRYPDTAYQAHGNYAIQYDLSIPLQNQSETIQSVAIAIETPIKEDVLAADGLRFFVEEQPQTFFRGTVQIRYLSDAGFPQTRYYHLVQRRGQVGETLAVLTLPPGTRRLVRISFLYPPDATPPQVLTIQTQN
ncbi:DUF3370 domain-containing protein [Leptolyngbya sp. AN02str]|uniref:DUF3370 domain-containing protein n=1 Tax=Leptolyngbya sp. AN02str TaxID=3423363 RepID=UPI003D317345